jgi:hypothetical protein
MSEIKIITHTHEHIHASHGHKHDNHTYGFKDVHKHEHEHQVIIYGDERGYQIVGESLVGTHILVEEEENV